MRKIQIVPWVKIEEMRKYFYNYLTELSEFDPDIKFDKNGTPIYNWYDCYWTDKKRYPIYLIVDDKIAGLALIRELEYMIYEIAEFYVCPEFRKDQNSIWFATQVVNLFYGQINFSTRHTNPRAIKFWDKFSKQFQNTRCFDDDVWRNWSIRILNFQHHTLNLNPEYFNKIKSGEKTLEGRLNDEKRRNFNPGDKLTLYKEPEKIETLNAVILDKYLFNSFDDMVNKLNPDGLGFHNKTKKQIIDTYRSFYSLDNEHKFGVVVFKIKVI